MMRNDDAMAMRLAGDADRYAERAGLATYLCALIGSRCSQILYVPVPIDNGFHEKPRPVDLKYEFYLATENARRAPFIDLDYIMVHYPDDGVGKPSQWTLICSNKDMAMENTLIRTFPGAVETLRGPCHGSYLVVKTNEHGVVCNVGPEDASDVMNVVVQALSSNTD